MNLEQTIRQYILKNFLFTEDESKLGNEMSFLDHRIIDSTGVLEVVNFIEENFQVKVEDAELIPENFDSVSKLVAYLQKKIG